MTEAKFKFAIDDRVIDAFGKEGIVTDCAISKSGNRYYVIKENHDDSRWEAEDHLTAKQQEETRCTHDT